MPDIPKGLETLDIRMKAHSENAHQLAAWLVEQPQISHVNYAGLPSHPQKQLIDRQMQSGGGVLSFSLKDGGQDLDIFKCHVPDVTDCESWRRQDHDL